MEHLLRRGLPNVNIGLAIQMTWTDLRVRISHRVRHCFSPCLFHRERLGPSNGRRGGSLLFGSLPETAPTTRPVMLGRPTVRSFVDAWAPPPKGLWSSCEHDRGAVSITVSKSVAKIQQLAQSFDCEHLRMRTLPALLFAIGVRPRPRNLHGAAIEVLNDEAMLVRL